MKVVKIRTAELADHQKRTNGRIGSIELSQAHSDGALSFARWVLGVILAVMSLGTAIAGVILGFAIRGA